MNIIKANNLACPIDGEKLDGQKPDGQKLGSQKLEQIDKQLVCKNGHSFDIARQGYVNLLPVQHKRSKQPGDSKAMVLARSHFLNTGIYQAIANKLTEMVSTLIINDNDYCLLDAGCGEGYYFDFILKKLRDNKAENKLSFIGLDISKDAIMQATKRNKQISWVVGTNRKPPIKDESVDIILCLFGLRKSSDFSQTNHAGFSLVNTETLQFKANVCSNEQVNNLLLMTPHFYRASKTGREAAYKLDNLEVTVDVIFNVLQKNVNSD